MIFLSKGTLVYTNKRLVFYIPLAFVFRPWKWHKAFLLWRQYENTLRYAHKPIPKDLQHVQTDVESKRQN